MRIPLSTPSLRQTARLACLIVLAFPGLATAQPTQPQPPLPADELPEDLYPKGEPLNGPLGLGVIPQPISNPM